MNNNLFHHKNYLIHRHTYTWSDQLLAENVAIVPNLGA